MSTLYLRSCVFDLYALSVKVSITFGFTPDKANAACADLAFVLRPSVLRTCVPLTSFFFLPYKCRYSEFSFSHVWLKSLSHIAQVHLVKFRLLIQKRAAGLSI